MIVKKAFGLIGKKWFQYTVVPLFFAIFIGFGIFKIVHDDADYKKQDEITEKQEQQKYNEAEKTNLLGE